MVAIELLKFGGLTPWVARIVGTSSEYELGREFVEPRIIGRYYKFDLTDGIYEINNRRQPRTFLEVFGTSSRAIAFGEVKRWAARQKPSQEVLDQNYRGNKIENPVGSAIEDDSVG